MNPASPQPETGSSLASFGRWLSDERRSLLSWPLRRKLVCLFLLAMFFSGAPYYSIKLAGFSLNLSPANVMIGGILVYYWWLDYRVLAPSVNGFRRITYSVARFVSEPSWIRLPLLVSFVFVASILIGAFKQDQTFALSRFLTGVAGIGAMLVVIKSVVTWDDFKASLSVLVGLVTLGAVLTLLGSIGWLHADSLPFYFRGIEEGRVIDSFQFPVKRLTTFGFVPEIWAAQAIIALAALSAVVGLRSAQLTWRPRVAAFAISVFLAAVIVIVQNRSAWIALVVIALPLLVVQTWRLIPKVQRIPLLALSLLLPWAVFGYALYAVGGPIDPTQIGRLYVEHNRPYVFGIEMPREFFTNLMIRISFFKDAWNWARVHPLTGAPGGELANFNGHAAYPDLLAVAGVLPLIILAVLLLVVFTRSGRTLTPAESTLRQALGIAIYGLLTLSLFFFGLYQKEFFIACALLLLMNGRLVHQLDAPIDSQSGGSSAGVSFRSKAHNARSNVSASMADEGVRSPIRQQSAES